MTRLTVFRSVVLVVWLALVGHLVWGHLSSLDDAQVAATSREMPKIPGPAQETWMGVYLKDQKIGYTHQRFTPSPGGFRFLEESLLRMSVLETEQIVRLVVEGETGPDYALRKVEATLRSGVGKFTVSGSVEGGELVLTIDAGGDKSSQRLPLQEPIYLAAGERQSLVREGIRAGQQKTVQVFDASTMQYQPMQSTVERQEVVELGGVRTSAWRVQENFRSLTSTVWIDAGGTVLREEGPLGLVALLETPEQALAEGWRKGVAVDLTAAVGIPVATKLPNARGLRHLEIRVEGVPDGTIPDDYRQRSDHGRLVIDREDPETRGSFRLPYGGDEWKGDLAATPFLQVGHPRVLAAAREAAGQETDARRVTEAIREWVFLRLEKVPTASIPNAVQVLEMGAGDCNEHAVLFAALARAVGLPSRVVAGAVYSEGVFLYHAWDEVWLGSGWLSVDPTFDQMPADATHIKLIEGGPEVHDGLLRVIGRLSMEVVAAR
jgi:hypothetical protein